MEHLTGILAGRLSRYLNQDTSRIVGEFGRFGAVGTLGFIVDTATVYGLRAMMGLYAAGIAAYMVAATVTWAANRHWTFRDAHKAPAHRQWVQFLSVNLIGFIVNRGVYSALIWRTQICETYPIIAIAAGALAGMILNYRLSRSLVFRRS